MTTNGFWNWDVDDAANNKRIEDLPENRREAVLAALAAKKRKREEMAGKWTPPAPRDMTDPANWRPHPHFNEHPTLIIDRSDTKCGVCGESADYHDKSHGKMLGYAATNGRPGCGAVWTHVASNYVGLNMKELNKELRPDLIWCGYDDYYDAKQRIADE